MNRPYIYSHLVSHLMQIEDLPSSPSPRAREGEQETFVFVLSPSPFLGEGLGGRVLKLSA